MKIHYHDWKIPPLVRFFNHMHTIHKLPPHCLKINCNIFLPSMLRSSEWSLPFRLLNQNVVFIQHRYHEYYMLYPPLRFHYPNNVRWKVQVCSSSYLFLHPSVNFYLLSNITVLSTLFSNTLDLGFPRNKRDHVWRAKNNLQERKFTLGL